MENTFTTDYILQTNDGCFIAEGGGCANPKHTKFPHHAAHWDVFDTACRIASRINEHYSKQGCGIRVEVIRRESKVTYTPVNF